MSSPHDGTIISTTDDELMEHHRFSTTNFIDNNHNNCDDEFDELEHKSTGSGSDEDDSLLVAYDSNSIASV
jgi:hypothetical protein